MCPRPLVLANTQSATWWGLGLRFAVVPAVTSVLASCGLPRFDGWCSACACDGGTPCAFSSCDEPARRVCRCPSLATCKQWQWIRSTKFVTTIKENIPRFYWENFQWVDVVPPGPKTESKFYPSCSRTSILIGSTITITQICVQTSVTKHCVALAWSKILNSSARQHDPNIP